MYQQNPKNPPQRPQTQVPPSGYPPPKQLQRPSGPQQLPPQPPTTPQPPQVYPAEQRTFSLYQQQQQPMTRMGVPPQPSYAMTPQIVVQVHPGQSFQLDSSYPQGQVYRQSPQIPPGTPTQQGNPLSGQEQTIQTNSVGMSKQFPYYPQVPVTPQNPQCAMNPPAGQDKMVRVPCIVIPSSDNQCGYVLPLIPQRQRSTQPEWSLTSQQQRNLEEENILSMSQKAPPKTQPEKSFKTQQNVVTNPLPQTISPPPPPPIERKEANTKSEAVGPSQPPRRLTTNAQQTDATPNKVTAATSAINIEEPVKENSKPAPKEPSKPPIQSSSPPDTNESPANKSVDEQRHRHHRREENKDIVEQYHYNRKDRIEDENIRTERRDRRENIEDGRRNNNNWGASPSRQLRYKKELERDLKNALCNLQRLDNPESECSVRQLNEDERENLRRSPPRRGYRDREDENKRQYRN